MLDHYEAEWQEKCRAEDERTREVEQLRAANRHLSTHVKTLEASLATMNNEHVEIVRQLVLAKIAKEDMENELVKYKSMCARLSQQLADEDSGSGPHAAYESGTASLYTGSSHHSSYAQPAAQHLDTLTAVKSNGSAYSTGSRTSRSASPLSPPR
jgi:hypothetical protein